VSVDDILRTARIEKKKVRKVLETPLMNNTGRTLYFVSWFSS